MGWTEITAGWTLFTKIHKWFRDRKKRKQEAKADGSTTTDEASGTGDEAGRETRSKSDSNKQD